MFTGIVEAFAQVKKIQQHNTNIDFWFECQFTQDLKIDQSVAHNGVCLTVVEINENEYRVTAIEETLQKTNLQNLEIGDFVNIERASGINTRLDGHIVQGHVDCTAKCTKREDKNGSVIFTFNYKANGSLITVPKGSICVNGVSLTVVESEIDFFSVAIIPFTLENTNFKFINTTSIVNLEFDIIGKYVARYMELFKTNESKS